MLAADEADASASSKGMVGAFPCRSPHRAHALGSQERACVEKAKHALQKLGDLEDAHDGRRLDDDRFRHHRRKPGKVTPLHPSAHNLRKWN